MQRGGTIWRRSTSQKRAASRSLSRAPAKRAKSFTVTRYKQYIPRSPALCPQSIVVRLSYSDQYAITSGVLFDKIMAGNSCYDPDYSGTGHQPMGFDQWMAFYFQFRVLASSIKVTTINTSSTATVSLNCVLLASNDPTSAASDQAMEEQPEAKEATSGVSTGPSEDTVSAYMTTAQIKAVPDIRYSSEFSGSTGANPTNQWYWHITHGTVTGAAITANVNFNMVYTVEFYSPKTLVQS